MEANICRPRTFRLFYIAQFTNFGTQPTTASHFWGENNHDTGHIYHQMTKLPQPHTDRSPSFPSYRYIPFDRINDTLELNLLKHDQLVWILKSKGQRYDNHAELFERARVISYDKTSERVHVRYSKGSTYKVRRRYVVPVLESSCNEEDSRQRIVVVCAETNDYRRQCVVHTCVGEAFLEIGCDFGPCVDRVRKALCLPSPLKEDEACETRLIRKDSCHARHVIGIDKAPESIDIAKERYPDTTFAVGDALTSLGMNNILSQCLEKLEKYPGKCKSHGLTCDRKVGIRFFIDSIFSNEFINLRCCSSGYKWK